MRRWKIAVISLCAGAAAALAFRSAAASAPQDDPDFEGFVLEQSGEVRTYPQSEGWEGTPGEKTFTLDRRGLTITYYGDFVAEERKAAKRSEPSPTATKSADAFTVVAQGRTRYFPAAEGWTGSTNATGLFVRRRGQTVWFYGTARVESPK